MPRRYPPEFRRKVLDLLKSGRTVAEVAAGLDVTEQTIYNWLGPGAHRYRTEAGAELDRERRTRRRPSSYRRVGDRACHRQTLHGTAEVGGAPKRRFEAIAVRMVRALRAELGTEHGAVSRVASQLGFGLESVRAWVRQADIDDGAKPGVSTSEAQRIRELEQENRELKRANEILKRAASFFGAEQGR